MGILKLTLWDFDSIESHNIPNQAFDIGMVGQNKAEAMAGLVKQATGTQCEINGKWEGQKLSGIVFSCVDNMDTRKDILTSMGRGRFIETRMGVSHGQVFTINPKSKKDVEFWMSKWSPDDVIEETSACGSSLTIGATANLLSSIAAWQGIYTMNALTDKSKKAEKQPRCIIACVNPYLIQEI